MIPAEAPLMDEDGVVGLRERETYITSAQNSCM